MNQFILVLPALLGCYAITAVFIYAACRAIWHAHHPGQSFWRQKEKAPKEPRVKKERVQKKVISDAPDWVAPEPVVSNTPKTTSVPNIAVAPETPRSTLFTLIQRHLRGEVEDSMEERKKYSRDTSLFTKTPSLVVYPKDANDVAELVKAANEARTRGMNVSVTARSAGTDMSGGPLTDSIVAVFTRHMNHILKVGKESDHGYAVTEPGVYYRDFEKETLKQGFIRAANVRSNMERPRSMWKSWMSYFLMEHRRLSKRSQHASSLRSSSSLPLKAPYISA
jgi:hypothetical protein